MEHQLRRKINAIYLVLSSIFIFAHGNAIHNNHHDRLSSSLTLRNSEYMYTCTSDGLYGNDKDCTIFHRCVQVIGQSENDEKLFMRYDYDCPPGTIFDTKIGQCNYPWAARPTDGCSLTNDTDGMTTTTTHRPRPQEPPNSKKVMVQCYLKDKCLFATTNDSFAGLDFCKKEKEFYFYVVVLFREKDGVTLVKIRDNSKYLRCLEGYYDGTVYWNECLDSYHLVQNWIHNNKDQLINHKYRQFLYAKSDNAGSIVAATSKYVNDERSIWKFRS